MPDTLTAELAAIRERWSEVAYVGLKPDVVPEPGPQPEWLPDVARLTAAVEAVLANHAELPGGPTGGGYCPTCWRIWPCETYKAITRALTKEN